MLKYTVMRLGLFAVCLVVVWAVWLRRLEGDVGSLIRTYPDQTFWGLVIAAVTSMAISFFALRDMREDISADINKRVTQRLAARAEASAAEHPQRRGVSRAADEDAADEDAEADSRG